MAGEETSMICLEGLIKTRGRSENLFELRVPRFAVSPGQMVAVIGESGCGKSTLLDILALVMAPSRVTRFQVHADTGRSWDIAALWEREDEDALARLRRDSFSYVLQTGGLLPFLNVRRNICLPARIKGKKVSHERLTHLAARLGVDGCLDRMPLSLSLGQRQRVAILRALAHRPRLLLADEPTASVDKTRARAIMDDMQRLARDEGVAVVVVTHDLDLVLNRADRAYTFDTVQLNHQATRSLCRPLEGQIS
jgi:putative ABC transport system ATP-binding protein